MTTEHDGDKDKDNDNSDDDNDNDDWSIHDTLYKYNPT